MIVILWGYIRTMIDTFLTPYSISTMTDSSVESLPTLFLAYCALDSADQAVPMV